MSLKFTFINIYCMFFFTFCSSEIDSNNKLETLSKNIHEIYVPTEPVSCEELKTTHSKKYFTDGSGRPFLSKMDSMNIMKYAKQNGHIKFPSMESEPYIFFYLLPRIRSIINCNLYDSIINGPDSINFLGFSKYEMNDLINSDAVIIGEVVEKKDIFDSTKCYYFKRDYIIKVDEVLHSYFSLNINDRVLFKSPIGIAGGCNPSQPNVLDHSTHLREFNVGDKWIFFLKHNTYYIKFITTINRTNHYSDIYCPHAFYMYEGNGLFDFNNISIINNIREFYHSKF